MSGVKDRIDELVTLREIFELPSLCLTMTTDCRQAAGLRPFRLSHLGWSRVAAERRATPVPRGVELLYRCRIHPPDAALLVDVLQETLRPNIFGFDLRTLAAVQSLAAARRTDPVMLRASMVLEDSDGRWHLFRITKPARPHETARRLLPSRI